MVRHRMTEEQLDAFCRELGLDPYGPSPPQPQPTPASPSLIDSLDDFLILENISCVDADGTVFEHYPSLYVLKEAYRDAQGKPQEFTPYQAVAHCEVNNLFLPSFALTCNIIVALYYHRANPNAEALLQQYLNRGLHNQNTIINYKTEEIIHYPSADDFGEAQHVNHLQTRTPLGFAKAALQHNLLKNALKDPAHTRYVRQLTGLVNPKDLVLLGNYFHKQVKLQFQWAGTAPWAFTDIQGGYFGCYGHENDPLILASQYMQNSGLALGVGRI